MRAKPARAEALDELRQTFGDRPVTQAERRDEVTALFDRIAPRYDLMNDLMSFGLHRLWKRAMVRLAVKQIRGREGSLIDLAGGTGDIALAVRAAVPAREVIVADASAGMLAEARRRGGDTLGYLQAEGEALPVESASAAGVTLSFGLRNMTDPALALQECARVLAPGSSLILLEFSRPATWFSPFYTLHSRYVIPALGALVARDRSAYGYLVQSIRRFPAAGDIARELEHAGFRVALTRRLMFGVAVLHVAEVI
ncbi:MAG: ubiquinone/menaquinone biosynthesis methyltransferase [Rhodobacteraceae bacterium]|nr:ubiquinone/menaquinone biosynthesis methyltransferase [Paracoccaceae bacterium]